MDTPCHGKPKMFFEHVWPRPEVTMSPDLEALEDARALCRVCTVRVACYDDCIDFEGDRAERDRHGVWAYLTPAQRKSIRMRGTDRCPCGAVRDPLLVAHGSLVCPKGCGEPDRSAPKVHDHGDDWTPRHTRLAKEVVAWMVEHVLVGGIVPPPGTLASSFEDIRSNDMRRVYQALLADDVLTRADGRNFRRAAGDSVMKTWVPAHLLSHAVC